MRNPALCRYCGIHMRPLARKLRHKGGKLYADHGTRQHILPRRRGGASTPENLTPCCHGCNQTLEVMGDCPGALACMMALAKGLYGVANNETARYAAFSIGLRWQWLETRK